MSRHDQDSERLDLLGRPIPSGFDVQVVALEPGCELRIEECPPSAVFVEVDDGEVELELSSGETRSFGAGALLWLMGGRLRALPPASAVVIALWRSAGTRPDVAGAPVRDENSGERRLNTHDDNHEGNSRDPRS